MPAASYYPQARDVAARALIWSGVAACAAGLLVHGTWRFLPVGRFAESLLLAGLVSLLAWPLVRLRRWAWADALAVAWLFALVALTGVVPALAVAVIVLAGSAIGGLVVGRERPALAWLTGSAALAGTVGWLLPLPVHRVWIYLPVFALLILWQRHALHDQARAAWTGWRGAVDSAPRPAALSMLLLGLASAGAWLPTMQYDDLAYHLGLPWQLMLHGRYQLDPTHQVWALAPWAGDVLQALAQVVARQESRSALNVVWLAATGAGLWHLSGQLAMRASLRWAVLALFASLPLLTALMGGMQTELPAAAVTVALATLVLRDRADWRSLLAAGPLAGMLFALKPLHALAALGLLVLAAWRWRHGILRQRRALGDALLALLLVAGSSYTYSWIVAGNPVLPLFNALFGSPYFPGHNFEDARWAAGFGPDLLWMLTFRTSAYLEGWDGGFGFVLVALAGPMLLALLDRRYRALAACGLIALILPLAAMQYARYAFVGLVLVLPAAVAALDRGLPKHWTKVLVAVCVLNLSFQANSNWLLHTGGVKRSLTSLGHDPKLFARYAPERMLAAAIRERSPGAVVLDVSGAAHAEFAGSGRTTLWYSPRLQRARLVADADPGGDAWAALVRRERITELLVRPASLTVAQRAGLMELGAHPVMTVGLAQWWHVPASDTR